jgi:NADH-quinone oxidoreductase subunit N
MQIDLATSAGLALSLLPEIFLVVWGCLVLLVSAWKHHEENSMEAVGRLTMVGLVITLGIVLWMWRGDWTGGAFASMMALDSFRYATASIFLIASILSVAMSLGYLTRERILIPEYYALIIFGTTGMMFMGGGADLIVIFVGLELMSVSIYVLAGINRRSVFSAEAALKYFLLGAFASAFFLYGIALIYGATGTTNLTLIDFQIAASGLNGSVMILLGVGFLLIGFGFKVGAVPFHMWAPDVYDGSPTPVTAYMATAVKAAGFAALLRILLMGFGNSLEVWQNSVWWLAAITMILGNLFALAQGNLKKMLAYSSIGHAGYILVAVAAGGKLGASAFLFYIFAYTLMTVGSFTVLAAIGRDGERDVKIDHLSGLASKRPWLAFAMMVFMLSLLGFPGTAGFIGKWYILTAVLKADQLSLAVVLVIASLISAGFYLPVIMAMYMKPSEDADSHRNSRTFGAAKWVVAATAAALLIFGVWPNKLADVAENGADNFREVTAATTAINRPAAD